MLAMNEGLFISLREHCSWYAVN